MTSFSHTSPRVSVICIFHNEERFLEEAIQSVLAQTLDDWELLLADDGSTDDSARIARSYAAEHPNRITYLQHPGRENRGMSATRNLGLSHARGSYICFLDGDDIFAPEKLKEQTILLESHPEVGMLCSATKYWHSWTGKPADIQRDDITPVGADPGIYTPPSLLTRLYPLSTGVAPSMSSLLIRRKAINRIGGFENHFRGMYEDQAFLSKMYLNETVLITDQWWDCYRQHSNSACAVSVRIGTQPAYRFRFLKWFASYLTKQRTLDLGLGISLLSAMLPYRFPHLTPYLKYIKRVYEHVRWHAKQLLPTEILTN